MANEFATGAGDGEPTGNQSGASKSWKNVQVPDKPPVTQEGISAYTSEDFTFRGSGKGKGGAND